MVSSLICCPWKSLLWKFELALDDMISHSFSWLEFLEKSSKRDKTRPADMSQQASKPSLHFMLSICLMFLRTDSQVNAYVAQQVPRLLTASSTYEVSKSDALH